ncbi:Plant intracellular Ras-group-related LRR protein 5 [Euphorbia peplus]|nr:Plant intracellular Ras-group-related LRR protein 5 [Euphorbia peplus]
MAVNSSSSSINENPSPGFLQTVDEIMKLYRSLPPRPSIDQIEAAKIVIQTVNAEQQLKLDDFSNQTCPPDVPDELFSLLQQVRKNMVLFQSHEQRKEALHLVQFDDMFEIFAGFIQRASVLVSGVPLKGNLVDQSLEKQREDGGFVKQQVMGLIKSSSTMGMEPSFSGEGQPEKLSLMKVAAVIETAAKSQALVLDLKGKLMDQIEWLPISIGKLSSVTELYLSENRIMAIPPAITTLKTLTKLDIHSNQLINLPDSFGDLTNLTDLDLHANRLKSLPLSFGKLENLMLLDLSSNYFTHLPENIGELTSLKVLNAETNELEELPYTIGNCLSLTELRLDFNQLKALPEAIGKIENLEILTTHYNRIRALPTTMGNLHKLSELDVSFNEIDFIPENLCFAVSLRKLNVANNFANLRELPRSIGNLEMLEELDISDDQIRVLPESFRLLSKLRVFRADETPLEVPSRQVAKLGAQAVVEFMGELVAKKDEKPQQSKKKKGFWNRVWLFFCGHSREILSNPNP